MTKLQYIECLTEVAKRFPYDYSEARTGVLICASRDPELTYTEFSELLRVEVTS